MRLFILILLIFCQGPRLHCQKVHAFLFCNTKDPLIGKGARSNLNHMTAFVRQIATGLGYKLILHTLKDENFKQQNIFKEINEGVKQMTKLDVVIVYINTHGYKSITDQDSFPRLKVGEQLISSYGIHRAICKVEHRMLLTLIEACSEFTELTPQDSVIVQDIYSDANDKIIEELSRSKISNYNYHGYLNRSGSYIVSAGQAGSTSYSTNEGSFFTTNFIRAFNEAVDTSNHRINWQKLLRKASDYTYQITQYMPSHPMPIWSFESCEMPKILSSPYKAYSHGYDVTTSETDRFGANKKTLYQSFFRIDTLDTLDSVIFNLYYKAYKIVDTLRTNDLISERYPEHYEVKVLDKPERRGNDFNHLVFSDEEFKLRLQLYYTNGGEMDFYSAISFPVEDKKSWWKLYKTKVIIAILIVTSVLILLVLIYVKKKYVSKY